MPSWQHSTQRYNDATLDTVVNNAGPVAECIPRAVPNYDEANKKFKKDAGIQLASMGMLGMLRPAAKAGSGLWNLTRAGADEVMEHKGEFGTFYKMGKLWWTKDIAGHGGSAFKIYGETGKGLEWLYDADKFGNYMYGKFKGSVGKFISWAEFSGR